MAKKKKKKKIKENELIKKQLEWEMALWRIPYRMSSSEVRSGRASLTEEMQIEFWQKEVKG